MENEVMNPTVELETKETPETEVVTQDIGPTIAENENKAPLPQTEEKKSFIQRLLESLKRLFESMKRNSEFSIFQEEIMKDIDSLQFETEINQDMLKELSDKLHCLEGLTHANSSDMTKNIDTISKFIKDDTELSMYRSENGSIQYVLFNREDLREKLFRAATGEEISLKESMLFVTVDKDGIAKLTPPCRYDDFINPEIKGREEFTNQNFTLEDFDDIDAHKVAAFSDKDGDTKRAFFVETFTHSNEVFSKMIYESINAAKEGMSKGKNNETIKSGIDKVDNVINKGRQHDEALDKESPVHKEDAPVEEKTEEKATVQEAEEKKAEKSDFFNGKTPEEVIAEAREKYKPEQDLFDTKDRYWEELMKKVLREGTFKEGKLTNKIDVKDEEGRTIARIPQNMPREKIGEQFNKNYSLGYAVLLEKAVKELREENKQRDENTIRPYNDLAVTKTDKVYVEDRGTIQQFDSRETANDYKERKEDEYETRDKEEKENTQDR